MKKEMISEWTRQRLSSSLFEFMKRKPLDKISVTEVTGACGFPRSTFYYHFEDIYDLASWALADKMVRWLKEGEFCVLWGEGLVNMFRHCRDHYEICRCAIESDGLWRMADSYCDRCMDGIMTGVRELDGSRGTDPEFLHFLALFYGHAVLATVITWFRGDMRESPEEMAEVIDLIVKDNMIATLDRVNRNKNIFNTLDVPCIEA